MWTEVGRGLGRRRAPLAVTALLALAAGRVAAADVAPPNPQAQPAAAAREAQPAAATDGRPAALGPVAGASPDAAERLQVADPFLELRTGPGRGYPVFHVAARGEWVALTLRHTDWYQVRTDKGVVGWVARAQLQRTLTQAGAPKSFRDIVLDDYLARRLELGGAVGRFKGEPMLKAFASYRFSDALSAEGTLGQVQGAFSGTDFWHLNLHAEPWSDRRLSPTFGIGFGRLRNLPNASLVGAALTNVNLANVTLGLRWHLSERFVVRADYALHTAYLDNRRTAEYRALSGGLSFFF